MNETVKSYEIIAFCKWAQRLPLPELARTLKGLGFDGVDLPCRPGSPIDHANGPQRLPEAARIFADHGLKLSRLVTSLMDAGAETERLLATIRSLGIRKVRIDGFSVSGGKDVRATLDLARRQLAALEPLLAKHQVMGAIQNHSGPCLEVNIASTLLMLQDRDPAWLGVQYDPGHLTLSGEPIGIAIGLMGPYLHSVNLKSPRQEYFVDPATGRLTYRAIWVPLRDGMLDVHGVLKALQAVGYRDPLSVHAEYRSYFYYVEKDLEATNKLVAADVAYLRDAMKAAL